MTDIEKAYVQAARSLASHLIKYAKERRDEDKKAIAVSHTELARIHHQELATQKAKQL